MPRPETASGMSITLPGSITSSDVISFSISTGGHDAIDVTSLTATTGRSFIATPIGEVKEAQVSYLGSGAACAVGSEGNVTIGDVTFYATCVSSTASAAVNDVARYDATFREVSSTS